MKRFTETSKWGDPWFRKLPPTTKLLWQWLLDNCDGAGIIDIDLELASFHIGYPMGIDSLSELGERVKKLECGKWLIPKFISFQYGSLSADCKAHKPAFQSLEKHGLKGFQYPLDTVQEKEKVIVKVKDTEKDKPEKARGTLDEILEFAQELRLPRSDGEWFFFKNEETGWTKEKGKVPILDWKATMRTWASGKFFPSQKANGFNQPPKKKTVREDTML